MTLTDKQFATLKRFAIGLVLAAGLLVVNGVITLVSSNALGIAPTYQSLVEALGIPALMALQKWIAWETSQQ